jgi:hypothetical protein
MQTIACTVEEVVLGVDTHLDSHFAVVVDLLGRQIDHETFPTTKRGHRALIDWARRRGTVRRAGVEGTGSYGVALARALRLEGIDVFEVTRPKRQGARHRGKNDHRDALAAAKAVVGEADELAIPKARDGLVEAIRVLRIARSSAVKSRTQTILQLRNLLLTAPEDLREQLRALPIDQLVTRCARWHRKSTADALTATRQAMRSLARRHRDLSSEIAELDQDILRLTHQAAPRLLAEHGIGPRDRRTPAHRRRRQPRSTALRRRPGRSLRSQPRRSIKRPDRPPSPQPRRRSPGQQRPLDHREHAHDPPPRDPRLRRQAHR